MSFARDFGATARSGGALYTPLQLLPGYSGLERPRRKDVLRRLPLVRRSWHSCCSRLMDYKLRVPRMSNAIMGLRLKQQLTLTPRLQQSVKLLQLSALECVQELHQAIAQNPFLEESTEATENAETRPEGEEGSSSEDTSRSDLDFSGNGSSSGGGDDTPDWTEWTASPATLHDSLHEQLLLL